MLPMMMNNTKLVKELEEENEIIDLIYIGKTNAKNNKSFRSVLVHKKRNLYIMLTNGNFFSMEEVPDSGVIRPYKIS